MKHLSLRLVASLLLLPFLLPLPLASCGHDKATVPTGDKFPPATVNDLAVESVVPGSVLLRWTAPGDDGNLGTAVRYDIRYWSRPIATPTNWDSSTIVSSMPAPKPSGTAETYRVTGLKGGAWYFRLRAADEVGNVANLSNEVSAQVPSGASLLRVTDLATVSSTATSVTLTWTAPGSQTTQSKASQYDLRYVLVSITDTTFDDATRVPGLPEPAVAGTRESFTVTGLPPDTTVFFALKAADDGGEWSELSNVVSEATAVSSYVRLTTSSRKIGANIGTWSPDGESIVFAADWVKMFVFQLYRIPANGGDPVVLTNIPEGALKPSWSPDGTKLAFVAKRKVNSITYDELSTMAPTPGAIPTALVRLEPNVGVPSWSPDGSQIVYDVTRYSTPGSPGVSEMYVISAAGGTPVLLASTAVNGMAPKWSPDGTKIAFGSNLPPYGIRVMPATGGDPVQLTTGSASWPVWSPDGTRIAFSTIAAGNADVWVMSSTGENPIRLTSSPDVETPQSWAPDGHALCVNRGATSGSLQISDIWVLHL